MDQDSSTLAELFGVRARPAVARLLQMGLWHVGRVNWGTSVSLHRLACWEIGTLITINQKKRLTSGLLLNLWFCKFLHFLPEVRREGGEILLILCAISSANRSRKYCRYFRKSSSQIYSLLLQSQMSLGNINQNQPLWLHIWIFWGLSMTVCHYCCHIGREELCSPG